VSVRSARTDEFSALLEAWDIAERGCLRGATRVNHTERAIRLEYHGLDLRQISDAFLTSGGEHFS